MPLLCSLRPLRHQRGGGTRRASYALRALVGHNVPAVRNTARRARRPPAIAQSDRVASKYPGAGQPCVLAVTSGVVKRHSLTSPIQRLQLRRCSQGALFADLLLGCAQARHVVDEGFRQVDRGRYARAPVGCVTRAAGWQGLAWQADDTMRVEEKVEKDSKEAKGSSVHLWALG
jgi:hypothetical protein